MQTKYLLTIGLSASLLFLGLPSPSVSAARAGQKCKKVGLLSGTKKAPLVCSKVRGKLVWKSSKKVVMTTTSTVKPKATDTTMAAKGNATPTTSLTTTTTTVAYTTTTTVLTGTVSQRNAVKKGASYLKYSSFSRIGLIEQLLYEGFTQAQAEYGVGTTGL